MHVRPLTFATTALLAATVAGCASDGGLTTAAITEQPKVAAAPPAVDPQCVTLAAQIDQLRREGSVDRLEKAAAGKTSTVQVKRAAIGKQAELNKANLDYQAKCTPVAPKPATATAPAAAPAAPAPAAKPVAKAAKTAALAAPVAPKVPVKQVVKTVAQQPAAPAAAVAPAAVAPVQAPAAAPVVVTTTVPVQPAPQQ